VHLHITQPIAGTPDGWARRLSVDARASIFGSARASTSPSAEAERPSYAERMSMTEAEADELVGRATDLDRLAELLRSGGAILRGPAGIGKSAVLRHAASAATGRIVSVEGNEASGAVPFGPFAPLLGASGPDGTDPLAVASAIHDRLTGAALLTVDDAHRLDAASAGIVHRIAAEGVPLLLAVRSGEALPPAIESLWTRGVLTMHDVEPLGPAEVGLYIASRLGGPVDPGLARALHRASGGVPLYARELLRAALERGTVRRHRGIWVLHGRLTAGGSLASVLRNQLHAQPPGVRRAVDCLALTEPIELALLSPLVSEAELDRAEREGLVRIDDTGDVLLARLGHPLYRDVALEELTPARRRRVADLLLRSVDEFRIPVDPTLLAAWRLERADTRPPQEWLQAARQVTPTDLPLAEAFMRAAVSSDGGPEALLSLAGLLTHQHRLEEAGEVFDELAAIPVPPGTRIMIASVEAFLLAMPGQRPKQALALVEQTTVAHGASPELESARALALWRSGQVEAAIPIGRTVAQDPTASIAARASAALTTCSAEIYALRFAESEFGLDLALMDSLVAQALVELPEAPRSAALVRASRVAMPVTDLDAGLRIAASGAQEALVAGDDGVRAQFSMLNGWMLALAGDISAALEQLNGAHAGRGVWMPTTLPWLRATLVRVLSAAGRAGEAHELLDELEAAPRAGLYELDTVLARAAVLEAEGDVPGAITTLRAATASGRSGGNRLRSDELWLRRLRLGDDGAASEVHRRYGRREGSVSAAIAAHAAAVRSGDRIAISLGVGALASSRMLWDACEAQADLIRRHRAVGDDTSATVAVERLATLVAATRGLAVQSVLQELRPALTRREREIARLAASLPDLAIAERLGISVRTVQTHLTRVYRKLRVSGRADLAGHADAWPELHDRV